jgi:hypothetical protein
MSNLMIICSADLKLLHADRQTDIHCEAIGTFLQQVANAPRNELVQYNNCINFTDSVKIATIIVIILIFNSVHYQRNLCAFSKSSFIMQLRKAHCPIHVTRARSNLSHILVVVSLDS